MSYDASSNGLPELAELLDGARRVGVEEDHLIFARSSWLDGRGYEPTPAGEVIFDLRARKDEDEIEAVRRACALVEQAFGFVWAALRPDIAERELNLRVEASARPGRLGVASPRPVRRERREPDADPGGRVLRAGDVICADISACLDGYWGDLTRCATVGPPTDWARETWALVRDAQAPAIAACTPGTPARDVEAAQRRVLETRPDLGEQLHGAGHAIGLAIHEPPFLVPSSVTPLAQGMIFTVEPGLYQAAVGGIRLEDDVVVRGDSPRNPVHPAAGARRAGRVAVFRINNQRRHE